MIAPAQALGTKAAGQHSFNRNTVAHINAPTFCRTVTNGFNNAQGFVARHGGHGGANDAFILFIVTAADAAGLNPHQGAVFIDFWDRQALRLQRTRSGLYHGHAGFLHHEKGSPKFSPTQFNRSLKQTCD